MRHSAAHPCAADRTCEKNAGKSADAALIPDRLRMRIFGLQLFHHRIQPGGGDVTGTVAKTFGIESFNAENDLEYVKADHVKCLRRIASHLLTFAIHTPLSSLTYSWAAEASRLQNGEITEEEYNNRRYHYPRFDKGNMWAKVPPELK